MVYAGPRKEGATPQHQPATPMKVALMSGFTILCLFSAFNIFTFTSSWNNNSSATNLNVNAGPPVSNSTDSLQIRALLKEVEFMKNEHNRFKEEIAHRMNGLAEKIDGHVTFKDEIMGQIDGLVKKFDDLLASTSNGMPQNNDKDRVYKVHLWDDTTLPMGFREKKLYSVAGFSTNHRTTLVDSPEDADIIVWVSVRGNTEKEVPPSNYNNVVILDYAGMYCMYDIRIFCWLTCS